MKVHKVEQATRTRAEQLIWGPFDFFCRSCFVGALFFAVVAIPTAVACLPHPAAVTFLAFELLLVLVPIADADDITSWVRRFSAYGSLAMARNQSLTLVFEDEDAFSERPYMIAYEPHSSLPVGLPTVFNPNAEVNPIKALRKVRFVVANSVFFVPIIRHLWSWVGAAPATRESMAGLLQRGISCAVVPGGITECLYIKHDQEVVYLRKRLGFVRLALENGSPIVPVFCFRQTEAYSFYRPGPPIFPLWLTRGISKVVGFAPLLIWGEWGTYMPHPSPLYMVFGSPIQVPDYKGERPPVEEVQKHLDLYIAATERIFEEHKAAAGCPDCKLVVM